jgi:hypothetical protein
MDPRADRHNTDRPQALQLLQNGNGNPCLMSQDDCSQFPPLHNTNTKTKKAILQLDCLLYSKPTFLDPETDVAVPT